jgi:hypothetical protein
MSSRRKEIPMFRSSCLQGVVLILLNVGVASAIGPADSKSTESFVESRNQIVRWASGFAAKRRNSITGFIKPEAQSGGIYHYVNERVIFGTTARKEQCALHLGRRRESGEWVFNFYLENKTRPVGSVAMIHENPEFGDVALFLEGYLVVQSQPTVPNIEGETTLDLHTTASSMSLLSLDVSKSRGLGEESLSVLLDDEDNIIQITCRFINSVRIRDGRRTDPATCYFDHVS